MSEIFGESSGIEPVHLVFLFGPPAILCAIALVRRTWAWAHMVGFLAGDLIVAVAVDYYVIYVLAEVGTKFPPALAMALEIGLMKAGILSAVRALAFVVSLVVLARVRHRRASTGWWPVSLAAGMLAALGDRAAHQVLGASYAVITAVIAWGWILGFPIILALFLVRSPATSSDSPGSASPAVSV